MSSSETLECLPTGHWCVSQEDTAVSFCRTRGFEFSPRTPRKRARTLATFATRKLLTTFVGQPDDFVAGEFARHRKGLRNFALRYSTANCSQYSWSFYLWGCTPDPMPKAYTKKLKNITEFIWLFYPKATFATLRCPASSQRASFRVLRGKKSRVKISLYKTILNSPRLSLFSITYRPLRDSSIRY